jgi:cholinesterase
VRDNIAGFGGDPERITLFGQSAGGGSVDIYSFAYVSDPIAHAFLAESGIVTGTPDVLQTPQHSSTTWYDISTSVGCGDSSSDAAEVLACMRTKPYNSLLMAIPPGKAFGPTIDNIIVFPTSDYIARAVAGNFIKKPMLVGNNNYEAGLFKVIAEVAGHPQPDLFWDVFELAFSCPAATRAAINAAWDIPTWRYWYFGDFPDTRLTRESGAYHGAEIAQIWNTTAVPGMPAGGPPATDVEMNVSAYSE